MVVPGRSIDGPRRQVLVGGEDLLDADPRAWREGSEPGAVAGRVGHAVDVIDAQAVDQAVPDQLTDDAVGGVEDLGVLGPQGDQRVDIQEAAVVELVGRDLPAGEAVGLRVEEGVQRDGIVRQPGEHGGAGDAVGVHDAQPIDGQVDGGASVRHPLRVGVRAGNAEVGQRAASEREDVVVQTTGQRQQELTEACGRQR